MYSNALVEKVGQLSVQHDWNEALQCGSKSFWISYSVEGEKTEYGQVEVKKDPDGHNGVVCTSGFEGELIKKDVLKINWNDGLLTSYFFAPYNNFTNVHSKAVRCVDVSPSGSIAVSSGDDGSLLVWQTDNGTIRRVLEGHVNDISHCRFFPSGLVILSGGVDMRLKIWSVEDGSCPVTLTGHTGAITGTAIIDKGRNIVSSCRDGSARLWDCGSAQCLRKFETVTSCAVNNCSISRYLHLAAGTDTEPDEKEYGTSDKLLLLARDDGYIDGIDLNSKNNVFSLPCHSPVNDCCFINENSIVAGLQDGISVFYDIRDTRTPHRVCRYGKSSINCVLPFPGDSVLIGRGDGSCSCVRNIPSQKNTLTMELTGPNCDPLYKISCNNNFVYTACRDSELRKYKLQLI